MKITNYTDYLASLNNYSSTFDRKTDDIVLDIIQNVRQNGDTAIAEYSKKFDNVDLESFIVSEAEIAEAKNNVSVEFMSSMDQAAQNIQQIHCFRSEEHTSELQSRGHLVCRLLLEKKKKKTNRNTQRRTEK